ncbi:hypothetical protein F5Y04DRAFT_171137 [Hypomontagnella monticulosa]|nr:hypothetical protein F5Y04DRAFT_171137 [Hypomontagnella monticulosa]
MSFVLSYSNHYVPDMSEFSSQSSSRPRGFLGLPLELREEIYFRLLLFNDDVDVQFLKFKADRGMMPNWRDHKQQTLRGGMEYVVPKKTGILCASQQIGQEALNILYGFNTFIIRVHGGAHDKLHKFGASNIQRIRFLKLVAQPMGVCYPVPIKFDSLIWDSLLTDLIQFSLIVQQPLQARGYHGISSLEKEIRIWVTWLTPILRYLAGNIPERTTVGVDDNDLVETDGLMREFFRFGYAKVQTEIGDKIFKRSLLSMEPECCEINKDMVILD